MLIACADDASNTTPETITPAVNGIRVSTSTATSVTVTVNTNETGTLFWVVYTHDTPPPTTAAALIAAFKEMASGTVIANSGTTGQKEVS